MAMPITTELAEIEHALAQGELVGLPTDTVYGLACLASRRDSCEAIFVRKGRPDDLALPVLVADLDQALTVVSVASDDFLAAASLWPGPLTIVTERAQELHWRLGGDEQSVGIRCPDHELVRTLARRLGPLAVTSANPHREPPAQSARGCEELFGDLLVYDGGSCDGEPSTVVSLTDGAVKFLRVGSIDEEAIRSTIANG